MKTLVTGAGGFLGGAIARALVARGDHVRTFQRGDYPELVALGCEVVRGDLGDAETVARAVEGVDVVFHVAAKAGIWGDDAAYERTNVDGTRHVIDACRRHGVRSLVYTSSPSVAHGGDSLHGIDESAPYPERYLAAYPRTKAAAERLVLAANGPDLVTTALRPHLIWGPGDNHLLPRLVARHRAGRLRLVGDGSNRIDGTYVDNAVDVHLTAADQMVADGADARCAGKAYFVANDEPMPSKELMNRMLAAAGWPPITRSISPGLARAVGAAFEAVFGLLGVEREPPMTRFLASQLATDHFYDLSAVRRDLDYEPQVSTDEGMERFATWAREAGLGPA